jgi:hypothetical protein
MRGATAPVRTSPDCPAPNEEGIDRADLLGRAGPAQEGRERRHDQHRFQAFAEQDRRMRGATAPVRTSPDCPAPNEEYPMADGSTFAQAFTQTQYPCFALF